MPSGSSLQPRTHALSMLQKHSPALLFDPNSAGSGTSPGGRGRFLSLCVSFRAITALLLSPPPFPPPLSPLSPSLPSPTPLLPSPLLSSSCFSFSSSQATSLLPKSSCRGRRARDRGRGVPSVTDPAGGKWHLKSQCPCIQALLLATLSTTEQRRFWRITDTCQINCDPFGLL